MKCLCLALITLFSAMLFAAAECAETDNRSAASAENHVWNENDGHVMELVISYRVKGFDHEFIFSAIEDSEGAEEFGLSLIYLCPDVISDNEISQTLAENHSAMYGSEIDKADVSVLLRKVIERAECEDWQKKYYVIHTATGLGNFSAAVFNGKTGSRSSFILVVKVKKNGSEVASYPCGMYWSYDGAMQAAEMIQNGQDQAFNNWFDEIKAQYGDVTYSFKYYQY